MVIRSIALFSALTAVTGKSVELPMGDIPATSRLGSRILSQVSREFLTFDFAKLNGRGD